MYFLRAVVALVSFSFSVLANAHSGGLDANGCHSGSQPYHCHNGSPSGSSDSSESLSMRDLAIFTTSSFAVYSAFNDFKNPMQISPVSNNSGLGIGSSYIHNSRVWYSNSKVFDESSVINFGLVAAGVFGMAYEAFYGIGIHTHLHHGAAKEDEENEVNINLGVGRNLGDKLSLFLGFDSGPSSLSFGISSRY